MRKKAHQRIIRENHVDKDAHNLFGAYWEELDLSPEKSEVREVTWAEAKYIIEEYEWLGTMPTGGFLNVGLYIDGALAGVECFTNVKAGSHYSYMNEPATLLARGACVHWAPKWANSYLVSKAIKILERHYDGEPRYVMAYSDWDAGEIGTIYQAVSWTYLGHRYRPEWRSPDGQRYDPAYHRIRAMQVDPNYKFRKKIEKKYVEQEKQKMLDEGWYRSKTMRGTYITVIGYKGKRKKELQKKIKPLAQPYPKEHNLPTTQSIESDNDD